MHEAAVKRMTNDEFPMTKQIRNPKFEWNACDVALRMESFVLGHSFGIRRLDFVLVHSLHRSAATAKWALENRKYE